MEENENQVPSERFSQQTEGGIKNFKSPITTRSPDDIIEAFNPYQNGRPPVLKQYSFAEVVEDDPVNGWDNQVEDDEIIRNPPSAYGSFVKAPHQ